jgi:type II secretory pathway pseudopilin PulG
MFARINGFTMVELIVIIVILGFLSTISVISYNSWQDRGAINAVKSDLQIASSSLESYMSFHSSYTRNMAGTGFISSSAVSIIPYTNATIAHVSLPYTGLTPSQNVELFLYSCNSAVQDISRSCALAGSGNGAKVHIPGTVTTNTLWPGPICYSSASGGCGTTLTADCDGVPSSNCQSTIDSFLAQGGTFPIDLSAGRANLPTQPSEEAVDDTVPITRYCLEGRAVRNAELVYHIANDDSQGIQSGACPTDASLKYFPQ